MQTWLSHSKVSLRCPTLVSHPRILGPRSYPQGLGPTSLYAYVLTENERSVLCKGLSFSILPKKIDFADFLTRFELLYRETMFEMIEIQKLRFSKNQIKRYLFLYFEIE